MVPLPEAAGPSIAITGAASIERAADTVQGTAVAAAVPAAGWQIDANARK
jgi:hypothetical protein